MKHHNIWVAFTILWATWASIPTFAQKTKYADIQEALYAGWQLAGSNGPASVNWIDGGNRFSYLESKGKEGQEIRSYDPKTEEDALIFETKGMTFPGTSAPFEFSSFQWSEDSKYILFQSNFRPVWRRSGISDYYFFSREDKTLQLVAKDAQTAELSPNGKMVGYERQGNLFIYNFENDKETQLTDDAAEHFYNGRFGWVYEEEFGLAQAWSWSNDSRYIAFWQSDERDVPIFQMTDYSGKHASYQKIPYPKVGDKNPIVKIGVIDVQSGNKQWMKLDVADGYVPRLYWTAQPGKLAVVHLTRKQNQLKLFFFDATNGEGNLIMEETSSKWIDVFDFFAGIEHLFFFPKNLEEFFWVSDRDGWSHIYRYNYEGELLNQVTQGEWEVTYVHSVNATEKTIYYTSTEVSPLERHLFSVRFDRKKKTQLTEAAGRHVVDFSPNGKYYLDRYSNINTPKQVELRDIKGKLLRTMEANTSVSEFIAGRVYAPRELMSFTTSDGQQLDMYVVKPIGFDASKSYPLVLNIYGGPGAQSVYNEFGSNGWEQYLAQEGYVVASVNNRGSGGYGSAFEKIVYEQLGKWESHDFAEAAKYLASLPWVDGDYMAIRGHSYGGYMSSYTMLNHPEVFKVSLVGAPVTDWKLYDSIYTERYMGLYPENKANYEKSAATTYAGNLQGQMFIAHSAMDENVHMQNTMQLMQALIDNGKDADLRIYPPGAHGVAYNAQSYVLLYKQYTDYLNRFLKGEKLNIGR